MSGQYYAHSVYYPVATNLPPPPEAALPLINSNIETSVPYALNPELQKQEAFERQQFEQEQTFAHQGDMHRQRQLFEQQQKKEREVFEHQLFLQQRAAAEAELRAQQEAIPQYTQQPQHVYKDSVYIPPGGFYPVAKRVVVHQPVIPAVPVLSNHSTTTAVDTTYSAYEAAYNGMSAVQYADHKRQMQEQLGYSYGFQARNPQPQPQLQSKPAPVHEQHPLSELSRQFNTQMKFTPQQYEVPPLFQKAPQGSTQQKETSVYKSARTSLKNRLAENAYSMYAEVDLRGEANALNATSNEGFDRDSSTYTKTALLATPRNNNNVSTHRGNNRSFTKDESAYYSIPNNLVPAYSSQQKAYMENRPAVPPTGYSFSSVAPSKRRLVSSHSNHNEDVRTAVEESVRREVPSKEVYGVKVKGYAFSVPQNYAYSEYNNNELNGLQSMLEVPN